MTGHLGDMRRDYSLETLDSTRPIRILYGCSTNG
jgi:hypothetical protein